MILTPIVYALFLFLANARVFLQERGRKGGKKRKASDNCPGIFLFAPNPLVSSFLNPLQLRSGMRIPTMNFLQMKAPGR
jgi:hypothetical protein